MMAVCWPLSVSDFLKWAFVWQEQLLGSNTSCKGTIPNVTSSPLSVFPPHNLRSWQVYCGTDTVYKILAGLQDNSYLQGTNILIEKTPKNISQNQICCNRAIYKVLCVGVWKRNFSTSTLILNGYFQGRETLTLISLVQFTEAKPSSKEDPALYLAQGRNFRGGKSLSMVFSWKLFSWKRDRRRRTLWEFWALWCSQSSIFGTLKEISKQKLEFRELLRSYNVLWWWH